MKFIEQLYISNSIKDSKKVIWKLKHNIGQIKVYIVSISKHPTDQLDIYHCSMLQQKFLKKDVEIVALTTNYDEAVSFVRVALEDCFKIRGNYNLKEYLQSNDYHGIVQDRG